MMNFEPLRRVSSPFYTLAHIFEFPQGSLIECAVDGIGTRSETLVPVLTIQRLSSVSSRVMSAAALLMKESRL